MCSFRGFGGRSALMCVFVCRLVGVDAKNVRKIGTRDTKHARMLAKSDSNECVYL